MLNQHLLDLKSQLPINSDKDVHGGLAPSSATAAMRRIDCSRDSPAGFSVGNARPSKSWPSPSPVLIHRPICLSIAPKGQQDNSPGQRSQATAALVNGHPIPSFFSFWFSALPVRKTKRKLLCVRNPGRRCACPGLPSCRPVGTSVWLAALASLATGIIHPI
jgi:hypothetical protein